MHEYTFPAVFPDCGRSPVSTSIHVPTELSDFEFPTTDGIYNPWLNCAAVIGEMKEMWFEERMI
jgi:hypothetical protein